MTYWRLGHWFLCLCREVSVLSFFSYCSPVQDLICFCNQCDEFFNPRFVVLPYPYSFANPRLFHDFCLGQFFSKPTYYPRKGSPPDVTFVQRYFDVFRRSIIAGVPCPPISEDRAYPSPFPEVTIEHLYFFPRAAFACFLQSALYSPYCVKFPFPIS